MPVLSKAEMSASPLLAHKVAGPNRGYDATVLHPLRANVPRHGIVSGGRHFASFTTGQRPEPEVRGFHFS
jgi:hypothetical protein